MKKTLTMLALALNLSAMAQSDSIDQSVIVAVYDYSISTFDHEDKPVTDEMQVMVQVGRKVTKSMPLSAYMPMDGKEMEDIVAAHKEAMMHMPTVWIGWDEGMTTAHEFIFPNDFEGDEPTPEIDWTVLDDTTTIGGFRCQKATAIFRGVEWHAWYTEEIPSSAGPWRLRGLPGLIVKAESKVHTFVLAELRQEEKPITMPEQKPDVQRMSYDKYMKYKNKVYGNKQYAKKPIYYIPDLNSYITHMDVINAGGTFYPFANGHPLLLTNVHVYQPLELE